VKSAAAIELRVERRMRGETAYEGHSLFVTPVRETGDANTVHKRGYNAAYSMLRRVWLYPLLVAPVAAAIAIVLYTADRVLSPTAATAAREVSRPHPVFDLWIQNATKPLALLVLQILVIITVARLAGSLVRRLRQPAVIGEIVAGIALGPSLLGVAFPGLFRVIFPDASLDLLQMLSQVGIILFMFVVGLELNWAHVRSQAHAAVAVSNVSILVPFLLGVLAAVPLYGTHAPAGVPFHAFGLFMGIAMSITAFPVLARILEERGLTRTPLGSTALTCAAVDDVTAWTLLTFVVAVVTSGGALATLGVTLAMTVLLTLIMVVAVRPVLGRVLHAPGREAFTRERIAVVIGVMFGSALATEIVGVHALFGAFLAGAIMPPGESYRSGLRDRLESFSSVFLLPLFFAFTGLRTELALLDDATAWLTCAAIIVLATAGKLGASTLTARVMGMDWNSAFVLGALMNTRGLMELVALNVGYDLGVISEEMFTALVLMALVTTSLTAPLVDAALHRGPVERGAPRHGPGRA
jgi:Kef-type K+ transport system membrane component KefB